MKINKHNTWNILIIRNKLFNDDYSNLDTYIKTSVRNYVSLSSMLYFFGYLMRKLLFF